MDIQANLSERLQKIQAERKQIGETFQKASSERARMDKMMAAIKDRELALQAMETQIKELQGIDPVVVAASDEAKNKQEKEFGEQVKNAKK